MNFGSQLYHWLLVRNSFFFFFPTCCLLSFTLQVCVNRLLADWGCGPVIKDDFIHEMCRYGAAEVHSIAAYIGGCAAHEVIKLLTGQYVPINNTHIYNAITATSETFML